MRTNCYNSPVKFHAVEAVAVGWNHSSWRVISFNGKFLLSLWSLRVDLPLATIYLARFQKKIECFPFVQNLDLSFNHFEGEFKSISLQNLELKSYSEDWIYTRDKKICWTKRISNLSKQNYVRKNIAHIKREEVQYRAENKRWGNNVIQENKKYATP